MDRKVSIIHAMIWGFVFTSGAGISNSGPMLLPNENGNLRVMRSYSGIEYFEGSN